MFPFTFLLIYPGVAGTSLARSEQILTLRGERQADAFRRLWQVVDDCKRGDSALPTALPWHGPQPA